MKLRSRSYHRSRGTVAFIVLTLIAVMAFFVVLNASTLYVLKQDLKLIEKRQIQHWTNHPPERPAIRP